MAFWQIADWQIESDLQFPDLNQGGENRKNILRIIKTDCLRIPRHKLVQESLNDDGSRWFLVYQDNDGFFIEYPGQVIFQIIPGTNLINYQNTLVISEAKFRHLLLDQVFPLFLSSKGYLVLHTSALAVKNGAIIFAGKSGSGKSTIIANLSNANQFISDDFVAFDSELNLHPTYPVVRLWKEPECVNFEFEKINTDNSGDKLRYKINAEDYKVRAYKPIAFVILRRELSLNKGDYNLTRIELTEAFKELLSSIFIIDPADSSNQEFIFRKCTELLSQSNLYSLTFSDLDGAADNLKMELNSL